MTNSTIASPTEKRPEIGPVVFPHFVGPGTRGMTTTLLYHGKLGLAMPAWLSGGPLHAFTRVHDRATTIQHPLLPIINIVGQFFTFAQEDAMSETKALEPLGKRISRVMTVGPSTDESYAKHGPLRWKLLPLFHQALADRETLCSASVEFVWRCWEIGLERGADPEEPEVLDPDVILSVLATRAKALRNPELLIAECALHRHLMPSTVRGVFATDSQLLALAASALNEEIGTTDPSATQNTDALSFFFFDQVLRPYTRPLAPSHATDVSRLMDDRTEALQKLRDHCRDQAVRLLMTPPRPEHLQDVIESELNKMKEAAAEIANADSRSVSKYFSELAQDEKVWGTVAGLLGMGTAGMTALTASFGVAALAVLGSKAAKVRQERSKTTGSSPYSFVYYANKAPK